jgi:predicted RNase H-like nuclease (RuvC/YqgF family)
LREENTKLNQLITRQNLQSQMLEEGFARMKEKADRAADWERMFNERNQVVKDLEYYLNEAQDKSKKNRSWLIYQKCCNKVIEPCL